MHQLRAVRELKNVCGIHNFKTKHWCLFQLMKTKCTNMFNNTEIVFDQLK